MLKNYGILLVTGLLLGACAGDQSVKVTSLQKKDKNLNCSEVMLEINEAEFYRKTAEGNKNLKVKSVLMPLGYVSTYVNAEEAVDAADARIDYLNRIYDILNCDNPTSRARSEDGKRSYGAAPRGAEPRPVGFTPMEQSSSRGEVFYHRQPAPIPASAMPQNRGLHDDWYW